ncbi:hypothetical protein GCM10007897_26910 [Sphingobium jiangsuense]|uniref:hypothetical protein n=1 Tax=Sphingobium jiangsuense TaxID=870476 RepID=UPI001CB6C549|nr:hypothetical protein [Sphingobium jiangsuense]GLT01299.1 hypothetical protein GCM10007897_26910 [Sphingobium jiangsuense]
MNGWRASRPLQGVFGALLLCVLAVRALVPTGYMPVASPQGVIISMCTGAGAVKAFVPTDAGHQDDSSGKMDGSCVFAAGLGHGLLQPWADAGPVFLIGAILLRHGRAIADLTVHRLAAPPPPAHAPPAPAR